MAHGSRRRQKSRRPHSPVSSTHAEKSDEQKFLDDVSQLFEERSPDFSKTINIALVGKVSSGKSSLMNAILRRTRDNPAVAVGATSGVTTAITSYRLHDQFLIIDSPGLDDVIAENSQETNDFLHHVDLGILVVTDSADSAQKKHYDDLKHHAKKVVVVLNKVDLWDDYEPSALQDVLDQWKRILGADAVYPTCTKGYDPKSRPDTPLALRGVDEVRDEIERFFHSEKKDVIFAHLMGNKTPYAITYITLALLAVAGEAFLPGSTVYITVTQAATICALYFLYFGRKIELGSVLAALPSFIAKSIGLNLFLWIQTFVPPTGVVNVAAALVAVSITLAMLATVNYMFARGYELDQKEVLQDKYMELKRLADEVLRGTNIADLLKPDFWQRVVTAFVS